MTARTDLVGIDVHVHPKTEEFIRAAGARAEQMAAYFQRENKPVSFEELADQYRARRMMAVLLNSDDESSSGNPPVPNDILAAAVRRHPDVFLAFGGVDPWKGKLALREIERCALELGLRGLKFNPGRQKFFPSDPRFYPIYEAAAKHGLIILFHTGMLGAGAGTPGGMGYKLKYTQPIHLDDVAADFPELRIIGAHPSWPWQEESLAIARHKSNFYIDLSGWAPKYFSPSLVQYANTVIQDKVLFGSDWPAIKVDRWLEEFAALPIKPEVRTKIMLDNAKVLFGID